MSQSLQQEFGLFRSILWPVHAYELRKLLPMLFMCFFICFNYSILRNVKDTLVITAAESADVIPYIKFWLILPCAILYTFIYTKLSNRYSQENVFYIVLSSFLCLFGSFAFILYPMRESLELTQFSVQLENMLPSGCHGMIMMCRHWTLAAFYVVAELWASMVLSVLFWGFANEITKIGEAKRFYGVMAIAANLAAFSAGLSGWYISFGWDFNPMLPFGSSAWEQSLDILVLIVIAGGLLTMVAYYWMNRNVLKGPEYDEFHYNRKPRKSKQKLALRDCFGYLSKSKYLLCIAVIVVAYNLGINLVEVVWKDQARQLYPSAADYNAYLYTITMWMGVVATVAAFMMPFAVDRFGWTKMAMVTPAIMFVTSLGFFGSIFLEGWFDGLFMISLGISPLAMAVIFGGAHNCLSKASKYSVFDMTKEMAFIPLSHEQKMNGKAAIDGVGSRFGKSGGSVIYHGLLIIFTSLTACTPYLAVIVLGIVVAWMFAVRALGVQFSEAVDELEAAPSEPSEKVAIQTV